MTSTKTEQSEPRDPTAASQPTARGKPSPQTLQLSRRWLSVSLLAVTLIPVTLAATVWLAVPSAPEPALPVEVFLEPVAWPPEGDDVKLMPGIRLRNPTDQNWTNVNMAINKRFYFYSPEPLPAGGEYRVPLSLFRTSGNQPYRPTLVPLQLLTVYAQVPEGGRAILDVQFQDSATEPGRPVRLSP